MATANDSDDYDEVGVTEITLEELVTTNPLPQRAKVTSGFDDPHNPENSFSTGDVIEAVRILCPFVALTYVDHIRRRDVTVSVPTSNPTRFRLPAPTSRPRVYTGVKQLVNEWPLVVVAHADHGPSFVAGDRLRLIRLDRTREDGGKTAVLELKNLSTLELVQLPFNFVAKFSEAASTDNRLYTLGELAEISRVSRQLILRHDDRRHAEAWIADIPVDFNGRVGLNKPHYLVEVQPVTDSLEDSDDDEANSFIVSVDSKITVIPCEADYVSVSYQQCHLRDLSKKPSGIYPRSVSILSWKEETTILQNQLVRPGDRLVLFSLETVQKLAVRVGRRRFFVPLDHPDAFCLFDDIRNTPPRCLRELLSASRSFPLLLLLKEDGSYDNCKDETLPREVALNAEMIVAEQSVRAAKIDRGGRHLQPSFRLPLRTQIDLRFYGRWKKSEDPPNLSRWDWMAEEVSKSAYHEATGTNWSGTTNRETVDFTWSEIAASAGAAARRRHQYASAADISREAPAPLPPPRLPRSASVQHTSHQHRPPPPPPRTHSSRRQLSTRHHRAADNAVDVADDETAGSDYEELQENNSTNDYSEPQTESIDIPGDGNLSRFTVRQLQQLMRQLGIPATTLSEWSRLQIDGQAFATMTDSQLDAYKAALPLVIYFRNCSRSVVLMQL